MKVIFLDFDGVLNSKQEVIHFHRLNKSTFLRRAYYKFIHRVLYPVLFTPLRPFQRMKGGTLGYRIYRAVFKWYLLRVDDHCRFCPIACSNLQYVLDNDPDVRIVVSSTWRSWGIPLLKKILTKNGIDASKVIDRTGGWEGVKTEAELGYRPGRGDQCKAWLDKWAEAAYHHAAPGITHFVAIDDDGDFHAIRDHLVQTDSHLGFTIRDAYKVLRMLGTKPNPSTLFDLGKEEL